MRTFTYQLMSAGDMSGNITSSAQKVDQMYLFAVAAVFTGAPVGTLSLEWSPDNINWITYTGSAESISASGNFGWLISAVPFEYIRLKYAFVSGTGSLKVIVTGKGPS